VQIAELLGECGIEVDRRRIELAEPIKQAGEHSVAVKLHRDLVAELKLQVIPEE
jgi:large subunit ribosomal protein L9